VVGTRSIVLHCPAGEGVPTSVAIVHDEPEFTAAAITALEGAGFHVVTFSDPMVAIDQIENSTTFDTLVTRINFSPGKPNGVSLALVLRNTCPNLHIVFVARSEHEEHTEGIGDFISHPVDMTQLVAAARSRQNSNLSASPSAD
jgi:DNA-binding NtrC family response regulator